MRKDLYAAMKGLAYEAACTAAGYDNAGAKIAGYRDVYFWP